MWSRFPGAFWGGRGGEEEEEGVKFKNTKRLVAFCTIMLTVEFSRGYLTCDTETLKTSPRYHAVVKPDVREICKNVTECFVVTFVN